eukprot:52400_1
MWLISLYLCILLFCNVNGTFMPNQKQQSNIDDIDATEVNRKTLYAERYYVSIINSSVVIVAFGIVCLIIIACILCRKRETKDSTDNEKVDVTKTIDVNEHTPFKIDNEHKYQSFYLMIEH